MGVTLRRISRAARRCRGRFRIIAAMAMDVMAARQEALRQQQKGELAQAEAGYRRVLEGDGNQPQALLLLGVVCQQTGRAQEAVELIARAVKLEPRSPQFRLNYGFALKACGRV